jgi:hypothetical protein
MPRPVRELVADRTATSSTWLNSDGTLTVRRYLAPHFYRSASGAWLPISPVLAATSGKAGWWHALAASWPVSFGPAGAAGGAEQLIVGGSRIGFAPLGVSDRSLEPAVAGATAVYPGLWRGVTLSEQVAPSRVTEAIDLASRAAPSSFSFRLLGGTARPNAAGGLTVLARGQQVGVIPPLTVTTRVPAPLRHALPSGETEDVTAASGARLRFAGGVVRVSVSRSWLAGLPAWAFPVVIDPTFGGQDNWAAVVSVDNLGDVLQNQTPNGMQVGVDSVGRT